MIAKALSEKVSLDTLSDYYELTKPGITLTVVMSMLVGFIIGAGGAVDYGLMVHALAGTWLIAAGTAAHNMYLERGVDGLVRRTSKGPLPDKRINEQAAPLFSASLVSRGARYK